MGDLARSYTHQPKHAAGSWGGTPGGWSRGYEYEARLRGLTGIPAGRVAARCHV